MVFNCSSGIGSSRFPAGADVNSLVAGLKEGLGFPEEAEVMGAERLSYQRYFSIFTSILTCTSVQLL